MNARRDRREPLRPVPDRVHAGDHREQHLRRADVARRLLAADVLLARLQRHAQRRLAVRVARHADDAAGQLPLELVLRREKRGVRTAVAERNAEPLELPTQTSAPHSPGGVSSTRLIRSVATVTSARRRARARRTGDSRTPRRRSPDTAAARRTRRRRSPPFASRRRRRATPRACARVFTTSIVCG